MKKKLGIITGVFFTILFIIVASMGIYYFVLTETIVLDSIPAPDIQEQIEIYEELGYCREGYFDGNSTEIQLTRYQRQKWIKVVQEDLHFMLEKANKLENMKYEISRDAKELTLIANESVSFKSAGTYLLVLVYDMELFQVLSGEEDWGIDFTLKDMDTNEILYTANFPEEKIKFNEETWEK